MNHNFFKLFLILAALVLILCGGTFAQNINATTHPFSFSSGAVLEPESGTVTTFIAANQNEYYPGYSSVTPMPIDFWFTNTRQTHFTISENGLFKFGATPVYNVAANNLATSSTYMTPGLAPYWDDINTGAGGSVKYWVVGTAPNRKMVVDWKVVVPKNLSGAANAQFQLWLHESTNTIEFVYGSGLGTNAGGYSVGIVRTSTQFASITTSSNTVAYGTANNTNTGAITAGTKYTFTQPDLAVPAITYTLLTNTADYNNRTLNANISDQSGVPISGDLQPRIYYRKNAGAYVSTQGVLTSGTGASGTWTFTIDNSLVGGVDGHDVIYYYVIAQDIAGTPNISSLPTGVAATDVNNITTHPASPNSYILGAMLSGTKTVGTGGDYPTLTGAGGLFEDIKLGMLTGNLLVNIISDLTEPGTNPLSAWANGAGGPFTVTINPSGIRTVTGSLKISGANGLTIDGLNDGTNSLALPGILFSMGASNNTLTRVEINGAVQFNDASGSFPVNCSNNNINNCVINASGQQSGIYFGSWVSTPGTNNIINKNVIKNFGQYGIHLDRSYLHTTISNNEIFQTSGGNYSCGVYIYNPVGNTNIFNNVIRDLRSTGTQLGIETAGIYYRFGGATDVLNIYNNVIILEAATTNNLNGHEIYGLLMMGAGTSNVFYNSIFIGGSNITSNYSFGLYRSAGTMTFKNNAIYNARSGSAPSIYYKNYGISVSNTNNFTSDNNLIYVDGVNGVLGNLGITSVGQNQGTDYLTLDAWRTASGKDSNSVSGNPAFTFASNLTPNVDDPNSNNLNDKGTPIAAISTDILGNPRSTALPTPTDIGAYEFTPTVIPVTVSGNAGVPGAVINFTGGSATADNNGDYSFDVAPGWTGTLTPVLAGYVFNPKNRVIDTPVNTDLSGQNFSATELPAGLISYWNLNETSGNTYLDLAQIGDGTGNVSPSAVTGQVGGAQEFNGTNTRIEIPASAAYDFATNENFTITFWYNGSTAPGVSKAVLSRYIPASYWYIGLHTDGRAKFYMKAGTDVMGVYGSIITNGSWHHVAVTRNGSSGLTKIYVDGALKGSATKIFTTDFSSADIGLTMGGMTGFSAYQLQGKLDEVAIFNNELSAADILDHYNRGLINAAFFGSYAPFITSLPALNGLAGEPYSYDVDALGMPLPSFSLSNPPADMTIDAVSGVINWVPAAEGNYTVTVVADNGVAPADTQTFIINVAPAVNLPAGLSAYWSLNEAAGDTYADITTKNNGTGNSNPTALAGQVLGAQLFNGSSDKIEVNADPSLDFAAADDFSIEYWFNGTGAPGTYKAAVSRYNPSAYWYRGSIQMVRQNSI